MRFLPRPMMLILLDGLGDRPSAENDGLTPAEAAHTPILDAMTLQGASGLHVPFGPGRAPSSELSHWALFGYSHIPFCGRAILEGFGHGLEFPLGTVVIHASLRSSHVADGRIWATDRPLLSDEADVEELYQAIASFHHEESHVSVAHLRRGEALLVLEGVSSSEITDSDPMFSHHPWMRPLPLVRAEDHREAERTAATLFSYLRWSRGVLRGHYVNERRRKEGRAALDVVTTKWAGRVGEIPPFERVTGLSGAAVASGSLYAGFAKALGMTFVHDPDTEDPGADIRRRIQHAKQLIAGGTAFVHVHTKATDEAGHTKDPRLKRDVIESIDHGLEEVLDELEIVIAVTGDHATPSIGSLLHSGDGSPLVIRAPDLRADSTNRFGECFAQGGSLGVLEAKALLPLLIGFAGRPAFLGSTIDPHAPPALIDDPVPMPGD